MDGVIDGVEIIVDILDLTHNIYSIYLELFDFELKGKKDNDSYLSLVKTLKEKINEEKELYELLAEDKENFKMLFGFVEHNPSKLIYLRMYGYMLFNKDNVEVVEDDGYKFRRIYSKCYENLFLRYLSFLEDYIEDDSFISVRNGLIYTKYYNIFMNLELEDYFINNKLDIRKMFNVDLLPLEDDIYNEMLECCKDAVASSVMNLLNSTDVDYDNLDKMVDIISSRCMLRASLSIVNDEEIDKLRDGINRILNEYTNDNNRKSVDVIRFIISNRVNSKVRVRKI